jgi:hypothetical protein
MKPPLTQMVRSYNFTERWQLVTYLAEVETEVSTAKFIDTTMWLFS